MNDDEKTLIIIFTQIRNLARRQVWRQRFKPVDTTVASGWTSTVARVAHISREETPVVVTSKREAANDCRQPDVSRLFRCTGFFFCLHWLGPRQRFFLVRVQTFLRETERPVQTIFLGRTRSAIGIRRTTRT